MGTAAHFPPFAVLQGFIGNEPHLVTRIATARHHPLAMRLTPAGPAPGASPIGSVLRTDRGDLVLFPEGRAAGHRAQQQIAPHLRCCLQHVWQQTTNALAHCSHAMHCANSSAHGCHCCSGFSKARLLGTTLQSLSDQGMDRGFLTDPQLKEHCFYFITDKATGKRGAQLVLGKQVGRPAALLAGQPAAVVMNLLAC